MKHSQVMVLLLIVNIYIRVSEMGTANGILFAGFLTSEFYRGNIDNF